MKDELREALLLIDERVLASGPWAIKQGLERLEQKARLMAKEGEEFKGNYGLLFMTAGQMAEEMDFINRQAREMAFRLIDLIERAKDDKKWRGGE